MAAGIKRDLAIDSSTSAVLVRFEFPWATIPAAKLVIPVNKASENDMDVVEGEALVVDLAEQTPVAEGKHQCMMTNYFYILNEINYAMSNIALLDNRISC